MTAQPRRRWFRFAFSLRTLFVVVTIFACWLGYHMNWIRQRHDALKWLDEHASRGSNETPLGWTSERPDLPWSLRILGEKPLKSHWIGARGKERSALPEYRRRVAEVAKLFPECDIDDDDDKDYDGIYYYEATPSPKVQKATGDDLFDTDNMFEK